ncbi:MAG TPA: hypothetical protein VNA88_19395 [Candidatus Kapabacteria bacterium]|jgi:hypothetical protein|nr:hypothetical protein [Candidatus Kapabacteria bacterium]
MNRRHIILFVLLAALVVALPELATACPACKETVRGQAGSELSAGFNYTVFGLIGMVFGLVATVAGVVVRAYRRRGA